ncbi:11872_t:CDS:2 [Diversispora eburnea]|uniref:11872_t:CDS:1 n=1 Tax=Diversispora eburnea TaxID=1213867 RepID=A0A9N8YY17_9GLOM|nr:11872_t:CDS:2 [Diversispora eburnea]
MKFLFYSCTGKFQKIRSTSTNSNSITKQLLNSECLQLVFQFLPVNDRALYSCLFVNKFWSKNVIFILWSHPFRNNFSSYYYRYLSNNANNLDNLNNSNNANNLDNTLAENYENKYFEFTDIPEVMVFSQPGCLSRIENFEINFHPTPNILQLLKTLPSICTNIKNLYVRFPKISKFPENDIIIFNSLINIIKSQNNLREFHLLGVESMDIISKILLSLKSQSKSLHTLEFNSVNLTGVNFKFLNQCLNLKSLQLWNYQGMLINNAKSFMNVNYRLKDLKLWSTQKSPNASATIIKHLGKTLKILWIDILSPEVIHSIINYCPILTEIIILDYLPKKLPLLLKLLKEIKIEKLTISRETSVELGVIDFSGKNLPSGLKYLKLDCGISVEQLETLLLTLILNYFKIEIGHLRVITKFVNLTKNLKVFGVGGKNEYTPREMNELETLQKDYRIYVIPFNEIDNW